MKPARDTRILMRRGIACCSAAALLGRFLPRLGPLRQRERPLYFSGSRSAPVPGPAPCAGPCATVRPAVRGAPAFAGRSSPHRSGLSPGFFRRLCGHLAARPLRVAVHASASAGALAASPPVSVKPLPLEPDPRPDLPTGCPAPGAGLHRASQGPATPFACPEADLAATRPAAACEILPPATGELHAGAVPGASGGSGKYLPTQGLRNFSQPATNTHLIYGTALGYLCIATWRLASLCRCPPWAFPP